MLSGYLAALSIRENLCYNDLCEQYIQPFLEVSLVNRWLFAHLGNYGYRLVLNRMGGAKNVVDILKKFNQPSPSKKILFRVAQRWYKSRLLDKQCMHNDCDCVWCRHGKTAHGDMQPCLVE